MHIISNWHGPFPTYSEYDWIEGIGNSKFGLLSIFSKDIGFGINFCGVKNNSLTHLFSNTCTKITNIENLDNNTISLYPNPFNDKITIDENNIVLPLQVTVSDIKGRTVFNDKITSNTILLNKIDAGIYFIQYTNRNNTLVRKRIIKY